MWFEGVIKEFSREMNKVRQKKRNETNKQIKRQGEYQNSCYSQVEGSAQLLEYGIRQDPLDIGNNENKAHIPTMASEFDNWRLVLILEVGGMKPFSSILVSQKVVTKGIAKSYFL